MPDSGGISGPRATELGERRVLDRSLAVGVAWTGGVKWVIQMFTWVTTLVVARLLTPKDFGIMGMATLVLGLIHLVNEFGIGTVIIQRKEITERLISSLGAFTLALGGLFFAVGVTLSRPIAGFFEEPRVCAVMIVLSVNFVVMSPGSISRSLLNRDMRFKALALIEGANGVATSVLTVVLAWMGFGYWALVAGSLASNVGATGAYLMLRPFRPRWPERMSSITRELVFGWHVVASRVAWYTYSSADFAVVGRVLGTAALGAYNIGWTLASLPVEKVSSLVMRVTPRILAKVQDRPEEIRRYLRLLTEGISVVTFPISIGMALVAPDFVPLVLGDQWLAAIVPLQVLALYGGFRSIVPFFAQILVATDHARLSMWFSVIAALFLIPGFLIGARWGPAGVAMAWVVVYPPIVVGFHLTTTFRIIDMRVGEYLRSLWPATSGCVGIGMAVLAVKSVLPSEEPSWTVLAASVSSGAVAYLVCIGALHRDRVRIAVREVRRLRRDHGGG